MSERRPAGAARGSSADSPLVGGSVSTTAEPRRGPAPAPEPVLPRARRRSRPAAARSARTGRRAAPDLSELRQLIPVREPGRALDDWGRSERVFDLMQPLLDFYYRYWFRVETTGIENVPSEGGALLTSNHSGALPPDAPMIMQAIRHEHPDPRPLYMLAEHWFKGYPGVGLLTNKMGIVPAHPANASRLLRDERKLALVFPEGLEGHAQALLAALQAAALRPRRLRAHGDARRRADRADRRGGRRGRDADLRPRAADAAAHRSHLLPREPRVPPLRCRRGRDVPAREVQDHASSNRSTCPGYGPDDAEDLSLVQGIAEDVRARIQEEVDSLVGSRTSVWFG